MSSPAADLASATRLFLARHAEALASGDGARTLEAVDGLLAALEETLPAEVAAARRVGVRTPPAPDLAALAAPEPAQREAWAHAVLTRRVSEYEGILLQLQLALRNLQAGQGDAFRLVALITAARTVLRGLEQAVAQWAEAVEGAPAQTSAEPGWAGVRAAREALLAGAPEAVAPALRRAFRSVAWAAAPEEKAALEAALAQESGDPVVGWALVDAIEALSAKAATMRRPTPPSSP